METLNTNDIDLSKRVSAAWTDASSIDELTEFMVRFIRKNFKAKLTEDWISYRLEITPLDLFDKQTEKYTPTTKIGLALDEKETVTKFCEIISLYRIQAATQTGGNYSERVFERIQRVFSEPPFLVKSLDSANIITNSSWGGGGNEVYRKLITSIDMFFNKFKDHKYSIVKVATLSFRNKDCGGLTAIRDLSKYLACPTVEALKYVMDA